MHLHHTTTVHEDNIFRPVSDFTAVWILQACFYCLTPGYDWPHLGLGIGEGGERDNAFAQSLGASVAKVLGRIHEEGVLYRDVALRNVLLQQVTRQFSSLSAPRRDRPCYPSSTEGQLAPGVGKPGAGQLATGVLSSSLSS